MSRKRLEPRNTNAKGYHYNKKNDKWVASISVNHKTIYLGSFNSSEEAKEAYLNAKKYYHNLGDLRPEYIRRLHDNVWDRIEWNNFQEAAY